MMTSPKSVFQDRAGEYEIKNICIFIYYYFIFYFFWGGEPFALCNTVANLTDSTSRIDK